MRLFDPGFRTTPLGYIFWLFFASRAVIYSVGYFAYHTFPVNYLPNLSTQLDSYNQGVWYGILARWDTNWFLYIADRGYTGILWAFFPLYPLSLRVLKLAPLNPYLLLTLFSNLLFLGILYLLYRIAFDESGKEDLARGVVAGACFFPFSFYFSAPYTESLSLFLLLCSYYLAKRGWWLGAFMSAMLAAATRVTGGLIVFLLGVEFLRQYKAKKVYGFRAVGFLLIPMGVVVYLLFLQVRAGDPLAFLQAQQAWMRKPSVTNLWLFNNPGSVLDKLSTVFYLGLVVGLFALRRWDYALYSLCFLAIPLSTGTFLSMPRLGMNAFPIFIALGRAVSNARNFKPVLLSVSAAFLAFYTAMFACWYWVA